MTEQRREASVGIRNAQKRVAIAEPGPWKTDPDWGYRISPSGRRTLLTRAERAIKFIGLYCRPGKGKGHGETLRLAEFQKRWLKKALSPEIGIGILATPRGNGKSSLGGALAVWALFDDDATGSPQVPIVATTIGQAVKSCYGVAKVMIEQEPELMRRAILYTGTLPHVYVPYNRGELFPIANDPDGLQGLDPSLAIVDEIGFQPVESWDSLRLAQGKRERSTVLGVGTPGFDRANALYHVRKAVKEGAKLPGVAFTEYAAPEGCPVADRKAWRKANPAIGAGFLRESALATDLAITQEGFFRTFRLGQWVDGVDCWLGTNGRAVWDGLTSPWDFEDGAPTWVGADVAIRHDTSAVVAIQQRPDGRYHATCRIWIPTDERPIDITDVMQHIRELAERYAVQAVSFDPRFMDVPAKYLADEGVPMVEVPQSPERMTVACGGAYELIMRGGLTHDGDEAFATQVLNAVPRFSERGFTLEKSKSRGKIDAAVALALAYDRAQRTEAVPDIEPAVIFGRSR